MDQAIKAAESALGCGEYRRVLQLLEPLAAELPVTMKLGAEVRLLQATAHQGLGDAERAKQSCRAAAQCGDGELRRQARALLAVLEAPVLQVPSDRMVQLPQLGSMPALEGVAKAGRRSRRRQTPPPPAPPPVGRTRSPAGFAALAMAVLIGLTLLMAGCVRVDTDFHFTSPGRVVVEQQLQGTTASRQKPVLLGLQELAPWLQEQVSGASELMAEELPQPQLQWRERNWLLGVQQQIQLDWDLSMLDPVPGLELHLHLHPFGSAAVRQAEPPVENEASEQLDWQPQPGEANHLLLRCWRWSGLGLGSVAVLLLLLVSLLLRQFQAGQRA